MYENHVTICSTSLQTMTSKLVVALGCVVSGLHLICAMVLISSIIAWLSLQFSSALPSALAFVVGVPCLICAIFSILMLGLPRHAGIFGTIFLILNIFIVLASAGLITPFILSYNHDMLTDIGTICTECRYTGNHTTVCVNNCLDECCFTEFSAPLTRVFLSFTGIAMVVSAVGVFIGLLHLFLTKRQPDRRKTR